MDDIDKLRTDRMGVADAALTRAGYKKGGRLINETESAKDVRITRKRGGQVPGVAAMPRSDKPARSGKSRGHGKAAVNVIVNQGAGEADKQQAAAKGLQIGAKLGAAKAAQALTGGGGTPPGGAPPGGAPPPGAMPPPGGGGMPPPGAMPDPNQPPMKRGGRT